MRPSIDILKEILAEGAEALATTYIRFSCSAIGRTASQATYFNEGDRIRRNLVLDWYARVTHLLHTQPPCLWLYTTYFGGTNEQVPLDEAREHRLMWIAMLLTLLDDPEVNRLNAPAVSELNLPPDEP